MHSERVKYRISNEKCLKALQLHPARAVLEHSESVVLETFTLLRFEMQTLY